VAKLPTYLQRMATLAPPWLPAPFIAMLAAAFALLGLALTVMSWRDDPGDEPSDGQSRAVSPQTLASTHGGGRE
jgi:hypothetical protein